MTSEVSAVSAAHLREMVPTLGALVTGRRTFDIAHAWGGRHPLNVPVVVMTHTIPQEWAGKDSVFTFVSDGIESAVARAQQIAGDKNASVGAASITQQCLNAGLLDEIYIDLVPVLLGGGVRLFDRLSIKPIELESIGVAEAPGVTHLGFRVVR
jgi:dihydrofolate reductase